jgi:protein involved in polysaccharide export with SLBB domain
MTTRPDSAKTALFERGGLAIVLALSLACFACGVSLRPATTALPPDRATAFFQARTEPSPTAAADGEPTVSVTGAVERPGQLVIGPYTQTLGQALDGMGGLSPGATVRIRPADDPVDKLFAGSGDATPIEIPASSLTSPTPIYLRAGDVIEVVAADGSVEPTAASATPAAAITAAGPPAAASPSASPADPQPAPAANEAAAIAPVQPQATRTDLEWPAQIAALRGEMEKRFEVLQADVLRLQEENARLRLRLEQSGRSGAAAPAVAAKRASAASAAPVEPREPPSASKEKPQPKPETATSNDSGRGTVRVSGSVQKPGTYPLEAVRTVRGALRAAGARPEADLRAVEVRADGSRGALIGMGLGLGAAPAKTVLDLVAVESGSDRDVPLRGGEVIFVPPARVQ